MLDGRLDGTYVSTQSTTSADVRVQFLRDVLDFFGVKFKISPAPRDEEEPENPNVGTGEVMVSCVGVGYSNVNKAMA